MRERWIGHSGRENERDGKERKREQGDRGRESDIERWVVRDRDSRPERERGNEKEE